MTHPFISSLLRVAVPLGLAAGVFSPTSAPVLAALPGPEAALPLEQVVVAAPAALAAPALPAPALTVSCTTTYVVQRGDTLWRIGIQYGVEWPEIAPRTAWPTPASSMRASRCACRRPAPCR